MRAGRTFSVAGSDVALESKLDDWYIRALSLEKKKNVLVYC